VAARFGSAGTPVTTVTPSLTNATGSVALSAAIVQANVGILVTPVPTDREIGAGN